MMKRIANITKNTILKSAELAYESSADFWEKAALLTISLSNAVQVGVIAKNKDIPKKEKAFMIPQEITGGLIDLVTFVVLAKSFKRLGKKLVNSGKIIPNADKSKKIFSKEFATTTNIIGSLLAVNLVSPVIKNTVGAKVQHKYFPKQSESGYKELNTKRYETFNNLKQNKTFTTFTSKLSI